MKLLSIIIIFLFSSIQNSQAGQVNKSVWFLMNEPVSAWDFGLKWLNEDIIKKREDWKIQNRFPMHLINYSIEKEELTITLIYSDLPIQDAPVEVMKFEACRIIGDVKRHFDINPKTGEPSYGYTDSSLNRYFFPNLRSANAPKTLNKDLDTLTKIVIFTPSVTCKSSLVDKECFCSK